MTTSNISLRSAWQEESGRRQWRNDAKLEEESQSGAEQHGRPLSRKPRLELAHEQALGAPETETQKHQFQDSQAYEAENLQTLMAKT